MDYAELQKQAAALTEGVPHPIANLANLSALLMQELERLNWAGFYLLDGDKLVLGPFQGRPACIEIPGGRGVCGTAAETGQTLCVPDVHAFPGHIACDGRSRSELVIPLLKEGVPRGVLDLDSPDPGRFTAADAEGLTPIAQMIGEWL